jgi:hypothetical protein
VVQFDGVRIGDDEVRRCTVPGPQHAEVADAGIPAKVVISSSRIATIADGFARTWRRPPTEEELRGLVEDYIRDEIFYREGRAAGLDRDDFVIRRRVRQKLEFLAEDLAAAEPSDEQLAVFLASNPARAAARAGQSICGRSIAIRSRQSQRSCWDCGAHGARNRRRCRGSSVCTPCRLPRRQRRRTCVQGDDNHCCVNHIPRSDGKICVRSPPRRSPAPLAGGQSPAWSSKEFRGRLTSTLDLGFIRGQPIRSDIFDRRRCAEAKRS